MSNVLITGGAGFIGCRLARRLLDAGHRVTVLDRLHPQVHTGTGRPADLPADATLLPLDIAEASAWDTALKLVTPEIVVHLAAETGTGQSLTEATRHGQVNVVGTTALMLDALHRHDVRPQQILLASSRAVYGEGAWADGAGTVFYPPPRSHDSLVAAQWDPMAPDGSPATPVAQSAAGIEPRPTNVYAATKLAQEHLLSAWGAAFGVPLTVLRLQNVFGAGQSLANSYTGVLTYFARQAAAGEQIRVFEDGDIIRDFVHVDDVVEAMVRACRPPSRRPTASPTSAAGSPSRSSTRPPSSPASADRPNPWSPASSATATCAPPGPTSPPRSCSGTTRHRDVRRRHRGPREVRPGHVCCVSDGAHELRRAIGIFVRDRPEQFRPTVRSLRAAFPGQEITIATWTPELSAELERSFGQAADVTLAVAAFSAAELANHLAPGVDVVIAVDDTVVVGPAFAAGYAGAFADARVVATCYLSNGAGYLSFPFARSPSNHQIADHDESSLAEALAAEPVLAPVPVPFAAGGLVTFSAAALRTFPLRTDGGRRLEPLAAEFSIRLAKRSFQTMLDTRHFVSRPSDTTVAQMSSLLGPEEIAWISSLHRHAPALLDTDPELGEAPFWGALTVARVKALGVRLVIDGTCLGPKEMGTQVQTLALIEQLAERPEVVSLGVALNGPVPAVCRRRRWPTRRWWPSRVRATTSAPSATSTSSTGPSSPTSSSTPPWSGAPRPAPS